MTCKTCTYWVQRIAECPDNVGSCDNVRTLPDTCDKATLRLTAPAIFSAWTAQFLCPATFGCDCWREK